MPSASRIAVIVKRIEFTQVRHLVWLTRAGDLDSCLSESPRAAALTERLPVGWRLVGVFCPGITLPVLASAVRATNG